MHISSRIIAATILTGVLLVSLTLPLSTHALLPFGGRVATLVPCDGGLLFITLGPPTPGTYIWAPGTRSYLFGPPSHSGQWLLGVSDAPLVCTEDGFPVGTGLRITFHGSSL